MTHLGVPQQLHHSPLVRREPSNLTDDRANELQVADQLGSALPLTATHLVLLREAALHVRRLGLLFNWRSVSASRCLMCAHPHTGRGGVAALARKTISEVYEQHLVSIVLHRSIITSYALERTIFSES